MVNELKNAQKFIRSIGMKKKTLTLLLAILIISQVAMVGCSQGTENAGTEAKSNLNDAVSAQTGEGESETETETESSRENVPDDLPELNYNGQNVRVLARNKEWFNGEMYAEELTGEVVNDEVYERDITVEERLGVVIDYSLEGDTNALINKNVTAGVDEFQIHVGEAVNTIKYGVAGNYYNLLGDHVQYLNLNQPWWSQYYTEQSSIMDCVFFATGDLFTSLTKLSFVTFANMQMVKDYGVENPYDLVREGRWTFDNMINMASVVYEDLNGNGKCDEDDKFGYSMAGQIGLDVYWSAFDLTIMSKDGNDVPSINVDQDKMQSVLEKLLPYYVDSDFVFVKENNGDAEQDDVAKMLSEDRMMFSPLRIMHTEQIRDMESDYALLPLPKWDENQDNYYTFVHDQYSIGGIPTSVQDPSMVSAVMEALAAESYRHVTPAYYDLVLNGKYIRDKDTAEMLDIAMDGIKIDFGWIYTYSLGSCSQALLRDILYGTKSANFSSTFAKNQKVYNKSLDRLLQTIEKIKDDH